LDETLQVGFAQISVPEEIFHLPLLTNAYLVRDGIVELMEIPLVNAPTQPLSDFLEVYGIPDEIWISTYSTEYPEGILPFILYLFYPNQGILATFGPQTAILSDYYVIGCSMDNPASSYHLWYVQGPEMTLMKVGKMFEMNLDEVGFLILPIEEATNLDVISFYETFKQPGSDACIETPRDIWPEQF
jgi:hypothetical protein